MPIAPVVLDALRVYCFFYLYCADWLLTRVL